MAKAILSSDKIHTLHHTFYRPHGAVKATLLVVHGMAEHSGRYHKFAEHLANWGIAVLTYDHLGHGRTIKNADELGFFNKDHPVQMLLQDVIIMADHLKLQYSQVPHFVMGHSMGSFIVRNVLQHHSSDFAGTILMGTSDRDPLIKFLLPPMRLLNKFSATRPNKVYGSIVNNILNHKLNDKTTASTYAWISLSKENIKAYEADPLCGFDFTNNGYWALLNLMHTALAKDWAASIDDDFPMLIISGKNDPVGNMGKGINKLTNRLGDQGFSQVQKILYNDMRHEPLNEDNYHQVFNDISNWILQRV